MTFRVFRTRPSPRLMIEFRKGLDDELVRVALVDMLGQLDATRPTDGPGRDLTRSDQTEDRRAPYSRWWSATYWKTAPGFLTFGPSACSNADTSCVGQSSPRYAASQRALKPA